MPPLSSRTLRYARAWLAGPSHLVEEDIVLDRSGVEIPASIVRPSGQAAAAPAWVVMHGITRPGRAHAQLVRFTRALASAGLVTIVPDVPEWRALRLSPHLTMPTIEAAIRGLRDAGLGRAGPVGVVGFSFGAPHAIASAGDPRTRDTIAGVCGFGGYGDIESTFRFMMSGEHEWGGRTYVHRPDPYGRWIVAANYLTGIPEHGDAEDVADALRRLAARAGDHGAPSWDPVYDPFIAELRTSVAEERRQLFDLFAQTSDRSEEGARVASAAPASALDLAEGLAEAARRIDPTVEPARALAEVDHRVRLIHGRNDHLIPFTEAYRLRAALRSTDARVTVTRLFGHSAQDPFPARSALREVTAFARALDEVLHLA
jgi:pimeloyl-ACP methyl ester carboxylesterase